jgi:hypothetical protein
MTRHVPKMILAPYKIVVHPASPDRNLISGSARATHSTITMRRYHSLSITIAATVRTLTVDGVLRQHLAQLAHGLPQVRAGRLVVWPAGVDTSAFRTGRVRSPVYGIEKRRA